MMKIQVNDILVGLALALLMIASVGGYLSLFAISINPSTVLYCMIMVYCTNRIAKAIGSKSEAIEVHVVQESPPSYYRASTNNDSKTKEEVIDDEPMQDINSEVLAQIHSLRMKDSMGQSNINHHEHETDGNQTIESLKMLQGMKDANR